MKSLILPFDINEIKSNDDFSINMSKFNFDVPKDQQKKASFIFLRNMNVDIPLDFSECSFEDKEEFIKLYLTEDIDVNAEILASTWIEILSAKDGGGVVLPSIFTSNEIEKFLGKNKEFIREIYSIINSLPIYSMAISSQNGSMFNINDFKRSSYDGIKLINFCKLSKFDEFSLLIDGTTEPIFYDKLFTETSSMEEINSNLPFTNLLSMLNFSSDDQNKFVDAISELLALPSIKEANNEEN